MTDLAHIASGLYALPLDEFTSARNERAKECTDKVLSRDVRALRKPSASAWVLNLMAAHRGDQLREALGLGAAMREAQSQLDRAELKKLGSQRQQLITALVREGTALAEESGHPVSQATALEVEQTLRAAMADAGAAAAVATGRLVRALEASGWEAVDLAGAVGGPFDAGSGGTAADGGEAGGAAAGEDPAAEARADLQDAEDRSDEAAAALERARERVGRLEQDREALVTQVRELRKRIRALEQDIDAIDDDADDAVRERTDAERAAKEATREAERARRAMEKLER